ncbi:alpha-1,3(6)-mannosylglycoprotein beta-1,6-N-acetyl-glucosaminyltransferase [Sarotherodon galilaeus]
MDLRVTFGILLISSLVHCVPAVQAAKCPQECFCVQLNVNCVNKNLTQVPPTVNERTVKLDLRGNDLQELPTGAFMHTPYLTHLSLQRCNIHKVKEGAFRGLDRLVFLDLANNNIEILHQESFDGLSSLKQLIIDRNRVEEIHPGAFSQLGFLNLLSLSHNQLVNISNMAFQGLQNIKRIRLSYNFLIYLDTEAFVELVNLKRLNLSRNPILCICYLRPLREWAFYNKVKLVGTCGGPSHLSGESLDAVHPPKLRCQKPNKVKCPANCVCEGLQNIKWLRLSYNFLNYLDTEAFAGLFTLTRSPKLSRLNLAGNPILCNCYLRPLREWAIYNKVKLMGTCGGPSHLSGENLDAVHPPELRCQSQEDIIKEEEAARIIPRPTEEPNKVKCPANCACEGLQNIKRLRLSYNCLNCLDTEAFVRLVNLKRLNLSRNPILCICYLRPLREWAFYNKVKLVGTCGGPSHLSGESLDAVHPPKLRCQSEEEEAARITP